MVLTCVLCVCTLTSNTALNLLSAVLLSLFSPKDTFLSGDSYVEEEIGP